MPPSWMLQVFIILDVKAEFVFLSGNRGTSQFYYRRAGLAKPAGIVSWTFRQQQHAT
jgi:hypothetical protein